MANRRCPVQPGVLDEAGLAGRLDDDIWPKAAHLEAALRVQFTQVVDCRGGEDVQRPEVEEGVLRHPFVRHRLSMRQSLDVRPVLLQCGLFGRREGERCGPAESG